MEGLYWRQSENYIGLGFSTIGHQGRGWEGPMGRVWFGPHNSLIQARIISVFWGHVVVDIPTWSSRTRMESGDNITWGSQIRRRKSGGQNFASVAVTRFRWFRVYIDFLIFFFIILLSWRYLVSSSSQITVQPRHWFHGVSLFTRATQSLEMETEAELAN